MNFEHGDFSCHQIIGENSEVKIAQPVVFITCGAGKSRLFNPICKRAFRFRLSIKTSLVSNIMSCHVLCRFSVLSWGTKPFCTVTKKIETRLWTVPESSKTEIKSLKCLWLYFVYNNRTSSKAILYLCLMFLLVTSFICTSTINPLEAF